MPTLDRRQFAQALAFSLSFTTPIFGAAAAEKRIQGTATYRERVALPEDATMTIQLVELLENDIAGEVVSEQVISPAGQVPVPFEIAYDAEALDKSAGLGLTAKIVSEGTVLFENSTPAAVETSATEGVELVLEKVEDAAAEAAPPISDIEWTAEEIAGVEDLGDTTPTLSIAQDGRAGGHGGCNRFFATAALNGEELSFSEIGSTFMACDAAVMEIEQAFFAALAATASYRIEGGRLLLLDAEGQQMAALTASV